MSAHGTSDELRRLRSGELPPEDVLRLTRHLATCASCAERAASTVNAPRAARFVRDALSYAGEPAARPRVRRRTLATAAAAVAVALVAGLLVTRDDDVPPPQPSPRPRIATPRPASAPQPPRQTGYGNAEWDALVATARRSGRLQVANVDDLGGSGEQYRGTGGGATHGRVSPAGEVVESTRPRFVWRGGSGIVSVYRDGDEVARSESVRGGSWTPPRELRRGETYTWQVELGDGTILPAPPEPPAMFRVASAAAANELAEARRRFPEDRVLLAALYARHGLISRAAEELRLARNDPDAARLLASFAEH